MIEKNRDIRLDFIRSIAIISVISVHFLLNAGFYESLLYGRRMFVMTMARTAFLPCVPLFLMLSGYLACNKSLSKKYYFSILNTLKLYLIISIACIIFKVFYLKQTISLFDGIFSIMGFTAVPYAWYINMYIGLFLLIPFLNIIYINLNTKINKRILLCTCMILTTLPSFNIKYVFSPIGGLGCILLHIILLEHIYMNIKSQLKKELLCYC